jgi:long-chain-fatty-acid--[acyl-carrier-protein] ligase
MLISFLSRALLSLRYRIKVKGLEDLTPDRLNKSQGTLFIPNHPALMDPLINFIWLWPKFRMRPLVIEYIYRMPIMKPFIWLVKAIPIPNFENAVNEWKLKNAERSVREIAEGLKKGESFILYPSGRLKTSGKELLGGSAAVHELLKECPDANVVLVRTTGLWGSSFSRALLGRSPDLVQTLVHGVKVLLKNLIFFAPRRSVLVEIEPNPESLPVGGSRIELNRFLENWYNRYPDDEGAVHETEPLKLVSYSRWKREMPTVFKAKKRESSGTQISDETKRKVYNEIKRILDRGDLDIQPEQNIAFDLGMDSLNIAEFIAYLAKNFEVGELHPEDLETVGSILELAEGGREARPPSRPPVDFTWPEEKNRPAPVLPVGRTLPEAFLNSCQRMDGFVCCGDDVSGVLSYKKMKRAVLVLAQYFKTWEEEHVAVMLPASAGAYIVILALQMAGKTPVMLNWTLGSRYLEEMMKISGSLGIVTSWRFVDRLANVQFGGCLEKLVFLEDIRKALTLKMKLRGAWLAKCSPKQISRAMELDKIDENNPCVILFTSGTEAVPKGVPLSHKNIISNQRSAMQCIEVRTTDVIYGILPPFHSFGFSVAGLFPLLGGIRVAFYPDPTDSYALAEGVERWKITFFCSAPSFLKGLFAVAKKAQLKTIRYFVSGAEKAPQELFDRVAQLQTEGQLVEGYGITECSPILTLNRPNLPPKGVGRLAPGIEMRTIHPETLEPLAKGAEGELCVRGDNVFHGYLGNPRSPFIEIDGKQWYRTGDLGYIDEERNVILSGRLKRFTKVGGEMISLGAVEETLIKALIHQGRISPDILSVAICSDEREGNSKLILFTTIDIDREEANSILQQAGFSNLVKISGVKKVEDIPLMGAGKTDYRSLQALC